MHLLSHLPSPISDSSYKFDQRIAPSKMRGVLRGPNYVLETRIKFLNSSKIANRPRWSPRNHSRFRPTVLRKSKVIPYSPNRFNDLPEELVQLTTILLEPNDLRSISSVCRRLYRSSRHEVRCIFFTQLRTDLSLKCLRGLSAILLNDPVLSSYVKTLEVIFNGKLGKGLSWKRNFCSPLHSGKPIKLWARLLSQLVNCASFILAPATHELYRGGNCQKYPTPIEINTFLEIIRETGISVKDFSVRTRDCKFCGTGRYAGFTYHLDRYIDPRDIQLWSLQFFHASVHVQVGYLESSMIRSLRDLSRTSSNVISTANPDVEKFRKLRLNFNLPPEYRVDNRFDLKRISVLSVDDAGPYYETMQDRRAMLHGRIHIARPVIDKFGFQTDGFSFDQQIQQIVDGQCNCPS